MKLLYFSDNSSGHNQRFLEMISQAGVKTWFLDPTSDVNPQWLPEGVQWVRCNQKLAKNSNPATFATFLPEFKRLLAEIHPDLVHAGPIPTCGFLTALSQFHPWLLTSWGSDLLFDAERGAEWKAATQAALSSADGFFCDCDTVRAKAKQFAQTPDSRIVQFPWGVQEGLFGPIGPLPPKEKFERQPGTHVFISTRTWEPLYGIGTLLDAFLQAFRQEPSLRLLLLGNGSEAARVCEFIRCHALSGVVHTPGLCGKDEMPKWFRAADSYVSCTLSDGASVSLLEAMATGLPVIVTDMPSNREWIVEGENGWLASPGSSGEFADRLLRAAHLRPEERALFSERNQTIVRERADWDRNFSRLLEMYERLTGMSV